MRKLMTMALLAVSLAACGQSAADLKRAQSYEEFRDKCIIQYAPQIAEVVAYCHALWQEQHRATPTPEG